MRAPACADCTRRGCKVQDQDPCLFVRRMIPIGRAAVLRPTLRCETALTWRRELRAAASTWLRRARAFVWWRGRRAAGRVRSEGQKGPAQRTRRADTDGGARACDEALGAAGCVLRRIVCQVVKTHARTVADGTLLQLQQHRHDLLLVSTTGANCQLSLRNTTTLTPHDES